MGAHIASGTGDPVLARARLALALAGGGGGAPTRREHGAVGPMEASELREWAASTGGRSGYASLARSRGVPELVVIRAAREDRLADIVALPVGGR